jgi:hypothetical protein
MSPSAGVFAADDAAVTELSAALAAAGYTVAARVVVTGYFEITTQLTGWVDDPQINVVIGTATSAAREAMGPLITKRVLSFSDLNDVEGGRCNSTYIFLVPPEGDAMTNAIANLLPRLESELASGKPAHAPVKVSIPERGKRPSVSGPAREVSVVTALPPVEKEVSVVAVIPPVQKKEPPTRATPPPAPPSRPTPPPTPLAKASPVTPPSNPAEPAHATAHTDREDAATDAEAEVPRHHHRGSRSSAGTRQTPVGAAQATNTLVRGRDRSSDGGR